MPPTVESLEPRVASLEQTLASFIQESHRNQEILFKKLDEQARLNDEKRDGMSRELGAKIDALKDGSQPNLMVIYTGLGVLVAVFGIVAAGLMWGVDREFAHVRTEYTAQTDALTQRVNAAQSQLDRLQQFQAEQVTRDENELQQRRMKDHP